MTRAEFIEEVNDIWSLRDFCYDNEIEGVSCRDEVYTYDDMSYDVNECLVDWAREYDWDQLRDMLDEIPTNYDELYVRNYDGDWVEYDDCDRFGDDKEEVLREVDNYYPEIWDDHEEEHDEECELEPETRPMT